MAQKKRDEHVTRQIHKLYWEANLQDKWNLFACYFFRAPSFIISNSLLPLFAALGIQEVIHHNGSGVWFYAWSIIGLSILAGLLQSIATYAINNNAIKGAKYVQNKVFENFLQKDYEFFGNRFTGSLGAQAARLREMFPIYGEIVTFHVTKQLTVVLSSLAIIAWYSPLLALVTLVSMGIVLGYTMITSKWRLPYRRLVGESSNVISGQIGDALSHGATVKSFATEQTELSRLQGPLEIWAKHQLKSWRLFIPQDSIRWFLAGTTTAVLLVISSTLYDGGAISITIVVLIQLYVIRLIANTIEISELIKRYEEMMGSVYEPMQTMMVEPMIRDPEHPKTLPASKSYELALDDVSFVYAEARQSQSALQDFSLTVKPGEKIGIVGYSGSGKTTLTKLLLRFMDVTSGKITLNNIDLRDVRQQDIRRIISYVPQEPLLFHRTISENIGYGIDDVSDAQIAKAAKLAYVDEFTKDLPQKFETMVGERGVKLSGGQRQRVAIARALLKDSPILVLDEATSALDSKSEKYIQDALWKLMKGRTALVIAHRLSTIQRMDRIVVLDKGKIVQIGTHDELKNKPGIYADLWAHQSGGYIGVPKTEDEE